MKIIKGGVTNPKGFKGNGLWCGIKRSKPDLALIYSDITANGAAVFTKNSVKAAPLIVCQKHIKCNKTQAIIINSGNANCFTGELGLKHAIKTTEIIAKHLSIPKKYVLVTSTGIIGKPLPFEKIENAAEKLIKGLSEKNGKKVAEAILTTDLFTKEISVSINIGGKKVIIGGCAKGSGMVAPNMATILAFVTTDVSITNNLLKKALKQATEYSFNRITVDGCMSTNDMLTIMANGRAENKIISKPGKEFNIFVEALKFVCLDLAKKIVIDGEGATKFIKIDVTGAKTEKQAHEAGLAIANSILVKTAAFGSNPNWGRVAQAVGALGIKNVTEKNLKIKFSPFDKKNIDIIVNLNIGKGKATIYTCDLSYDYVKINGAYN